ncbi:unnamed protein product [Spodoptera exigua]|nr:unnamed protein product [Spodoptera exigua]
MRYIKSYTARSLHRDRAQKPTDYLLIRLRWEVTSRSDPIPRLDIWKYIHGHHQTTTDGVYWGQSPAKTADKHNGRSKLMVKTLKCMVGAMPGKLAAVQRVAGSLTTLSVIHECCFGPGCPVHVKLSANEQSNYLMVSNRRGHWIPVTPEELRELCQHFGIRITEVWGLGLANEHADYLMVGKRACGLPDVGPSYLRIAVSIGITSGADDPLPPASIQRISHYREEFGGR